jgi:hypothetical protein
MGSENERRLVDYTTEFIAPLQEALSAQVIKVLRSAIDVEGIREMLPMLALSLLQHVKLPLLLTALGVNADAIQAWISTIKDFTENG